MQYLRTDYWIHPGETYDVPVTIIGVWNFHQWLVRSMLANARILVFCPFPREVRIVEIQHLPVDQMVLKLRYDRRQISTVEI